MIRHQHGYVTLTVAGLLAAVSIIAISLSHLSTIRAAHADEVIGRLLLDIELESSLNRILAEKLANGPQEEDTLAAVTHRNADFEITAKFSDVGTKLNILEADASTLQAMWISLKLTPEDTQELTALIGELQTMPPERGYQAYLLARGSWSKRLNACFDEHLTIFKSARQISTRGGAGRRLDGIMLEIHLTGRHSSGAERGLRTVILITGRRDKPFWTMDWQRFIPNNTGDCE